MNNGETGEVRFIGKVESVEGDISTILIYPEFCEGLFRVDEYRYIYILYWFHERDNDNHRGTLSVTPRRHGETEPRGVFASRSPSRPNPIGQTIVKVLSVEACKIKVKGLDAFIGSPIIDIKPYSSGGNPINI